VGAAGNATLSFGSIKTSDKESKRMIEEMNSVDETRREDDAPDDQARDNEENELEAEQESAAAMDADVPQPPGADQTTEGQPS
jgi:hypothetical protein